MKPYLPSQIKKHGIGNHGLIIEALSPEDFIQGTERSLEVKFGAQNLQPDGNWNDSLPDGERQNIGFETSMCVSSTISTLIEIVAKKLGRTMNLSERMIAKQSDTDPRRGNTPQKVARVVYKEWSVLEKEWPTSDAESVEDFYREIPEALKTLALARGAEWEFGYQFVPTTKEALRTALKDSPLGISVPAWHQQDGQYYRPQGATDNHFTVCYGMEDDNLLVFDSYIPFKKVMRADFLPSIAMRIHLKKQTVRDSLFRRFIRAIKRLLPL